jgi:transposase
VGPGISGGRGAGVADLHAETPQTFAADLSSGSRGGEADHELPFALWTRKAVCQLLAARFGMRVSLRTAGRYLGHWGLTAQKPVRRAYERDPGAVLHWIKEKYTAIRAKAKEENAEIHWADKTGICSDYLRVRSHGKRGRTPVIPRSSQGFNYNMISTINGRRTLHFMVFQNELTQPVLLSFLRRLLRSAKGKVFLIVDAHPAHHGKTVQRWLAAQEGHIALYFLLGTSPT